MRLNDYRKRKSAAIANEALRSEATAAILSVLSGAAAAVLATRSEARDETDPWLPTSDSATEEEIDALYGELGCTTDSLAWLDREE